MVDNRKEGREGGREDEANEEGKERDGQTEIQTMKINNECLRLQKTYKWVLPQSYRYISRMVTC